MAITLIDDAVIAGARCAKACEIIGLSERTLRRWRNSASLADKRQTPAPRTYEHALTEEEKALILTVSNSDQFKSLPPTQIVPKLADKGVYIASESSFYRVLKEHGQLQRRGREQSHHKHAKPQALIATGPNQVWSWDITYLPSDVRGEFYRLYLVIDVYSRFIVGWEVHDNESAEHASLLVRKACLRHKVRKDQLVLHSDNGSPMKGATMLSTLQKLGIIPSFSRPSVSDDNPYSEAMFRTLKYSPAYPSKPFSSLNAARDWVHHFVAWYNNEHCHSGIKFVTPAQRHNGEDTVILEQRNATYQAAKTANPTRWKGRKTRNWAHENEVWLNPEKEKAVEPENLKQVA
jgi:transposase InsO family protein